MGCLLSKLVFSPRLDDRQTSTGTGTSSAVKSAQPGEISGSTTATDGGTGVGDLAHLLLRVRLHRKCLRSHALAAPSALVALSRLSSQALMGSARSRLVLSGMEPGDVKKMLRWLNQHELLHHTASSDSDAAPVVARQKDADQQTATATPTKHSTLRMLLNHSVPLSAPEPRVKLQPLQAGHRGDRDHHGDVPATQRAGFLEEAASAAPLPRILTPQLLLESVTTGMPAVGAPLRSHQLTAGVIGPASCIDSGDFRLDAGASKSVASGGRLGAKTATPSQQQVPHAGSGRAASPRREQGRGATALEIDNGVTEGIAASPQPTPLVQQLWARSPAAATTTTTRLPTKHHRSYSPQPHHKGMASGSTVICSTSPTAENYTSAAPEMHHSETPNSQQLTSVSIDGSNYGGSGDDREQGQYLDCSTEARTTTRPRASVQDLLNHTAAETTTGAAAPPAAAQRLTIQFSSPMGHTSLLSGSNTRRLTGGEESPAGTFRTEQEVGIPSRDLSQPATQRPPTMAASGASTTAVTTAHDYSGSSVSCQHGMYRISGTVDRRGLLVTCAHQQQQEQQKPSHGLRVMPAAITRNGQPGGSRAATSSGKAGGAQPCILATADDAQRAPATTAVVTKYLSLAELEPLAVLGEGAFGLVRLVQHRRSGLVFALKQMSKARVVATHQMDNVLHERLLMSTLSHPFILRMLGSFQDSDSLFLALEFCPGGDLFNALLRAGGTFSPKAARYYAAAVTTVLQYLHARAIAYRDLKPENLLLNAAGGLRVADFGFAKALGPVHGGASGNGSGRTYTLCGTPEYLAPEIVTGRGHGTSVDWWALGVLLYEMLAGQSPFCDTSGNANQVVIYKNILRAPLTFPAAFPRDRAAIDLITLLLVKDPAGRLGSGPYGSAEVMTHDYFAAVDFCALLEGRTQPPIRPELRSSLDLRCFGSTHAARKDTRDFSASTTPYAGPSDWCEAF